MSLHWNSDLPTFLLSRTPTAVYLPPTERLRGGIVFAWWRLSLTIGCERRAGA